jgi:hypothetical protein
MTDAGATMSREEIAAFLASLKKLRDGLVKRIVRGMTHPTTAPYHDGRRNWVPPDMGLVGV